MTVVHAALTRKGRKGTAARLAAAARRTSGRSGNSARTCGDRGKKGRAGQSVGLRLAARSSREGRLALSDATAGLCGARSCTQRPASGLTMATELAAMTQ